MISKDRTEGPPGVGADCRPSLLGSIRKGVRYSSPSTPFGVPSWPSPPCLLLFRLRTRARSSWNQLEYDPPRLLYRDTALTPRGPYRRPMPRGVLAAWAFLVGEVPLYRCSSHLGEGGHECARETPFIPTGPQCRQNLVTHTAPRVVRCRMRPAVGPCGGAGSCIMWNMDVSIFHIQVEQLSGEGAA